eukprot:COSAG06_NODE_39938_length_407_cov_0.840909_1_plen_20_part_01
MPRSSHDYIYISTMTGSGPT